MHAVNAPSLPARRCPSMSEMSGSENIPHCPCMAMHLIELSHDPLSSGYAYDSVPLGRAIENRKNTQGGNSSIDYSASLEGQSNERGPVLRQLATWLLQVQ